MKKFLPALLIFISCLFLCSCIKEDPQIVTVEEPTTEKQITMEDVFAKIKEQEWNTINIRFKQSLSEEYFNVQLSVKGFQKRRAVIKITASFLQGEFLGNPMHLTTVFYDNGNFYLNQREFCDYIIAMDEQYIVITGFFKALREYIFIQKEDIGALLDENGMAQEKEIFYEYSDKAFKDIIGEAEVFLAGLQEENLLFQLTEQTAFLQADKTKINEIKNMLSERNLEIDFLDYIDFVKLEFGVLEKDKLYLRGECADSDTGETIILSVDFTKETPEEIILPQEYASFADFMKVYDRIRKLFGKLS